MIKKQQLTKKGQTAAEIFMSRVITEFTTGDSPMALTQFQRRLAKNYFITLDAVLAKAETGRLKKTEEWRDKVPVTWDHINMQKLAQDVVAVCRIGLDPAQKNHINMIPYKNNTTKLYDVGFIEGYRGIELKSTKYGLDIPDAVIVKLVYSSDKFKSIMKDHNHSYEDYEFEIVNDFDRGEIVGGFYYHLYTGRPEKNKLVVMTLENIEKRKPQYASVEFWGGEKPIWENGHKTGKTETVGGWHEEMTRKTIYRAAYNDITIDSQKIDADYMRMKEIEGSVAEYEIQKEITEKANQEFIDIESGEIIDSEGHSETAEKPSPEPSEKSKSEMNTRPSIKGKETPEPQKNQDTEPTYPPKEGKFPSDNEFPESPVETALRTAKEEKEKLQNPKENPGQVADLKSYLDSCDDKTEAFNQIKKDYFPNLCEEDRKKLIQYHKKLMTQQTNPNKSQGRDF